MFQFYKSPAEVRVGDYVFRPVLDGNTCKVHGRVASITEEGVVLVELLKMSGKPQLGWSDSYISERRNTDNNYNSWLYSNLVPEKRKLPEWEV